MKRLKSEVYMSISIINTLLKIIFPSYLSKKNLGRQTTLNEKFFFLGLSEKNIDIDIFMADFDFFTVKLYRNLYRLK